MTQARKGAGEVRDYVAYLLRLWREKGGGTTQYRGSLQDPHFGERVGFGNLEELFGYLRRDIGHLPETNGRKLGNCGEGP